MERNKKNCQIHHSNWNYFKKSRIRKFKYQYFFNPKYRDKQLTFKYFTTRYGVCKYQLFKD